MIPLTKEEKKSYKKQEACYIYQKSFVMIKMMKIIKIKERLEISHYTGKFRGAAHSKCNLNYKVPKDIPVIIHNTTYDTHFIINQLAEESKDELNCLGENMEKIYHFFCAN